MSTSVKTKAFLTIILFSTALKAKIATASTPFYCQAICSADVLVSYSLNPNQTNQTMLLPQYSYLDKFIDENSVWNATNLLARECKILQEGRLIVLNSQISKVHIPREKNKVIENYLRDGFLSLLFQPEQQFYEKLQRSDAIKNASRFLESLIRSDFFSNTNLFQSQIPNVNDLVTIQNNLFDFLIQSNDSNDFKLKAVQKNADDVKIWQLTPSPYKNENNLGYLQERLTTKFENGNPFFSSKLRESLGKQASLDFLSTKLNLSTPALVSSINVDFVTQSLTEAARSESTLASKTALEDLEANPDHINYKKKIQALAERLDSVFCQKVSK
ncbi:MAG: hypothetical protein K1X29_10370 [Bdellovibrionales bacterium]|nr:hypothetical protein [Bdellovibrionales bacterium]